MSRKNSLANKQARREARNSHIPSNTYTRHRNITLRDEDGNPILGDDGKPKTRTDYVQCLTCVLEAEVNSRQKEAKFQLPHKHEFNYMTPELREDLKETADRVVAAYKEREEANAEEERNSGLHAQLEDVSDS